MRAQAAILAVCLWGSVGIQLLGQGAQAQRYLYTNDFMHFYTIGSAAHEGRAGDLYDWRRLAERTKRLNPVEGHEVFLPVYGPQVAVFFTPWARLPYTIAAPLWSAFTVLLCAAAVAAVLRSCPRLTAHRGLVWLALFASPALWKLVLFGQTSALLLLCFTAATYGWLANRPWLLGTGIGGLFYKPHFAIVPAIVLVVTKQWRAATVAGAVAAAQVLISMLALGVGPWLEYIRSLSKVSGIRVVALEPLPEHLHSLRTFWVMLLPSTPAFVAYLLTAAIVVALLLHLWRTSADWRVRTGSLLLAVVLVTPHVGVYDLVILFPAWLLLADWMSDQPRAPWPLLYLAFALPLLDRMSTVIPVRLPVLATMALFLAIWRLARELRSTQEHQRPAESTV